MRPIPEWLHTGSSPLGQDLRERHFHQELASWIRDLERVAGRVLPLAGQIVTDLRDRSASLKLGGLDAGELQTRVVRPQTPRGA
jgi:hypothetical protein